MNPHHSCRDFLFGVRARYQNVAALKMDRLSQEGLERIRTEELVRYRPVISGAVISKGDQQG